MFESGQVSCKSFRSQHCDYRRQFNCLVGGVKVKKCTKCGETKPREEFSNSSSKKCKDGKFFWCRSCAAAANKAWRERNAEKLNASRREKYAKNPEKIRAFMRDRYWRDPEARRADSAAWREKNPEKHKEMLRNWYASNAESAKAATKARYLANREDCLIKGRARCKRHYADNKEMYYASSAERRAKKAGSLGKLTRGIRKRLFAAQGGKCIYCSADLGRSAHLDHVIPLAKGGEHSDDNVQLLCPPCNLSKGAKMPDEFLEYRKKLA